MRAFGKGYEEFYQRIESEGVHMIRGKTATVKENNGALSLRSEDILNNCLIEQEVDMVILAVGLEPSDGVDELSKMTGVELDSDGWFVESDSLLDPVSTKKQGITIAGVCQGPKDIPDAVVQASAAAARVLQSIEKFKEVETI